MPRDAVATAPPARVQRAGEGGVALARRANSGPLMMPGHIARASQHGHRAPRTTGGSAEVASMGRSPPGRASTTSTRTRSTMPTKSLSLTRVCPAGSTRVGTTSLSTTISRENRSDVEGWNPVRRRCRIATYHGGSDHSWEPQQYDAHQMSGENLSQDEIFRRTCVVRCHRDVVPVPGRTGRPAEGVGGPLPSPPVRITVPAGRQE